jgi:alkylation response protein AidB-like acyl-CoA dehydrogenase
VVSGQKVWTSGAHDADVLLTFVRTDPDAPKHKGISVLLIPTGSPGVARRPFASASGLDDQDFNEVFFTDVRVPAENLVGEINQGWRVATKLTATKAHSSHAYPRARGRRCAHLRAKAAANSLRGRQIGTWFRSDARVNPAQSCTKRGANPLARRVAPASRVSSRELPSMASKTNARLT